jgi:hypothetical protein
LILPGRPKSEMDLPVRYERFGCEEIRAICARAVERERIELPGLVAAVDESVGTTTTRVEASADDIADSLRPLALNP